MIKIFALFILISYVIRTLNQVFFQVYLWQIKEYRIDRIVAHIKTQQGRKLIFSASGLIKWFLLLVIYGFSFFNLNLRNFQLSNSIIIYSFFIFWTLWVIEAIMAIVYLIRGRIRFPVFTLKATAIIFIVVFITFLPLFNTYYLYPLLLAPLLDKIIAPTVAIVVLLINIPFYFYKSIINYLARQKLTQLKLKTIGITGSFGKTSTKYFLQQILSSSFKVYSTPGSINTDIGISTHIINNLNSDFDILIAEMGAYRKDEINKIATIIKPQIAVITGIGNQHLELFGSVENIIKAKYELIENLKPNSYVVFNTNQNTAGMIQMSHGLNLNIIKSDLNKDIKFISQAKNYITFQCRIYKSWSKLKVYLAGVQNLENLLLAIKVAEILKINKENIKKAVLNLNPPPKTMNIVESSKRLTVIDDTFNVNYEGIQAAINYLKLFKGKKIIFINPIIELGDQAHYIHRKIGEISGNICDYVVTTNNNYNSDILKGMKNSKKNKSTLLSAHISKLEKIKSGLTSNSVIIFSGKESAKWMDFFINHKTKND